MYLQFSVTHTVMEGVVNCGCRREAVVSGRMGLVSFLVLGGLVFLDLTGEVMGYKGPPGGQGKGSLQDPCGQCDQRKCPFISADTCAGHVVKDECGCCPVCIQAPKNSTLQSGLEASACNNVKCPRNEVCVLNIQGIPICRCPSVFWCRRRERREICGRDGKTYKSRCYLRIAECGSKKKIRVAHKGSCESGGKRKKIKGRLRPRFEHVQQDENGPMQQQDLSKEQQHQRQHRRQQQRQQELKQQQKQSKQQSKQRNRQEGPMNQAREIKGSKRKLGPKRQRKANRKAKSKKDKIKRRHVRNLFKSGCTSSTCHQL